MNQTIKNYIQKVVAVLIIMIMTLADFSIIGANVISYAIDMVVTNDDNVEFLAYFKDESGEKIAEINKNINEESLKMYVEVSVKNEGYFEGAVKLGNSSFSLGKYIPNEYINSIEGNVVNLNKITYGTTVTLELQVKYNNENEIKASTLNQENEVKLEGTYTKGGNKKTSTVQINGTSKVKINWRSPDDVEAKLSSKILTNKIYEFAEEENTIPKRMVQVLLNSKLSGNSYPAKETKIELDVPDGAEQIKVNSRSTYATNRNEEFNDSNYTYNEETRKLTITIANNEKEEKIAWNKDVKDTLVVTYIYPESTVFEQEVINSNVAIVTYDDKTLMAESTTTIQEDIDGIVTTDITEKENEIYKGKIYTGETRKYITATTLNIDYAELVENIEIKEREAKFKTEEEEKKTNIEYVGTKIEKAKFDKIFGEEGNITIYDQEGAIISSISKDTEVVDGNIVVRYNEGVKAITITTSKPVSNGILDIVHTKAILTNNLAREEVRELKEIKEETTIKYNNGEEKQNTKTIELKETTTNANITITPNNLSTITKNENVEIVATLETDSEAKDLYKNPIIKIVFPKEIEEVHITQAEALYRNGLTVKDKKQEKTANGNIVLTLEFAGEQKTYAGNSLNGLEVHFKANIVANKTTPSKDVSLKMQYTNENGTEAKYEETAKIHLKSQNGLMLYNKVENFNKNKDVIETLNSTKAEGELDTGKSNVKASTKTVLINNYDKDLKDVKININLSKNENKEKINAKISNISVSNSSAHLDGNTIKLDSIKAGSKLEISYKLNIADNLSTNMLSNLGTTVTAEYNSKEIKKTSTITLATEEEIVTEPTEGETITSNGLEYKITATLGNGRELSEDVYNGETIKYKVEITNKSENDYQNVTVKATQTNGKILDLVEEEVENPTIYGNKKAIEHYLEVTDKNIKEFTNQTIEKGKTLTLEYEAVVDKTEGDKTYSNISVIGSDNKELNSVKTKEYNIKDSELKLIFTPGVSEECTWATDTNQQSNLFITNLTNNTLKNVTVKIALAKGLKFDGDIQNYITYGGYGEDANVEEDEEETNSNIEYKENTENIATLILKTINPNSTIEIYVNPYILEIEQLKDNVELYSTAEIESKTYSSNRIKREVTQVNKNIKLTKKAIINGKEVNEASDYTLKDNDSLKFIVEVENKDTRDAKLRMYNYIQNGLMMESVSLNGVKFAEWNQDNGSVSLDNDNEGEETENDLSYINKEFELKAGEKATFEMLAKVSVQYILPHKSIVNEVEIYDTESNDSDKARFEFKVDTSDFDNGDEYVRDDGSEEDDDEPEQKEELGDEDGISKESPTPTPEDPGDGNETPTPENPGDGNETPTPENPGDGNETPTPENPGDGNETPTPENPGDGNQEPETKKYTISGVAWNDKNKDGKRDDDEELIQNMEVKAIDAKTEEVIETTAKTNEKGEYELTLPEGEYIIAFMYDNENYYITTYKAKKVSEELNSDAVTKTLSINNKKVTVGATDTIDLKEDKKNIDIGIINRNKFDLKIEKKVKKVVVTNKGGTKEYKFDDTDLAKVEVAAKYLSGTTVVVEYKIKVTNVGDVAGYAKNIVDYMPTDMTFSSTLNKEWYQSGKYLYTESVADNKLNPGESCEVDLVLTKTMTESNTGLVNNTAKIKTSYNEKSFSDADTANNSSSADIIISVKTGAVIKLALLTISLTTLIAVIAYYVTKKYINKKI